MSTLATMQDDPANLPASKPNNSPEIQSPMTNQNPDINIKVSGDDSALALSSIYDEKKKLTTHLQVFEPVQGLPRRFIYSLISILVFTALIPLLVVSFLLIRLLQFIRHGHGYYKVTKLKFYIRFWMYNFLFSTALYFGIGSVIAEHRFKHGYWRIKVESLFYFKMCGIFISSIFVPCVILPLIPPFPLNHIETGLNIREGVLEIIDCVILWWLGGSVVMKHFPILKDHQSLGLHTQKWIEVSLFVLIGYNVITICTHMIVLWLQDLVREDLNPVRAGEHSMSKSDVVDEWEQEIEGLRDKDDECKKLKQNEKKLSRKVKKRVKDDLLMQDDLNPTMHGIQQVAHYLLTARKHLLNYKKTSGMLLKLEKESENGIIGKNLMRQFIDGGIRRNNVDEEIQQSFEAPQEGKAKHEFDYFFVDQLHDQSIKTSDEISIKSIRAWMDEARTNCLILADTLSSATEVVDCLNNIISLLLIAATFIMWLLLTGLATTKLLVIIASPLLAATFIFGESCKTLFQGIIYTFVVHPFDVGDLCIIDGKMMEVRTIGVWKTTFTKVDTQEEVIFTNSQLSSKDIVNHRTKFDWNDSIELDIASLNKQKIINLKKQIKDHLDEDKDNKFTAGYYSVMVLTTEDKIKLAINFRHNKDGKNRINSENLKTKQELRSELVIHVHDLLEQIKKEEPETQENSTERAQKNKELGNSS